MPPPGSPTRPRTRSGLLLTARNEPHGQPTRAASDAPLAALGWAYLDAGRWDEALELTAEAGLLAGTGITSSTATLITATIEAARGDTEHSRALVADVLAADVGTAWSPPGPGTRSAWPRSRRAIT